MSTLQTIFWFSACGLISAIILVAYTVPIFSGTNSIGFISINLRPERIAIASGVVGVIHGLLVAGIVWRLGSTSLIRMCIVSLASTAMLIAVGTTLIFLQDFNWGAVTSRNFAYILNQTQAYLYNLAGWLFLLSLVFLIPSSVSALLGGMYWKWLNGLR